MSEELKKTIWLSLFTSILFVLLCSMVYAEMNYSQWEQWCEKNKLRCYGVIVVCPQCLRHCSFLNSMGGETEDHCDICFFGEVYTDIYQGMNYPEYVSDKERFKEYINKVAEYERGVVMEKTYQKIKEQVGGE